MKKLLGLILAGAMVLSMSMFAFASSAVFNKPDNLTPSQMQEVIKEIQRDWPGAVESIPNLWPNSYAAYQAWLAGGALAVI